MSPILPLIICFGDSLTAGFQAPTPGNPLGQETPYGDVLQERLGERARIEISGICGELTGEMVLRFSQDVVKKRPATVVILGGTNDLGWNAQPTEIMSNLSALYSRALSAGITPILVTVPSIRIDTSESGSEADTWVEGHLDRRRELNGSIQAYAERHRLPFLDLFTATADPETQQLAACYSNDGLHLSTQGYQLFGTLLYEEVFLPQQTTLLTPRVTT